MLILKKGATGESVEQWQIFLRGLKKNSEVVISGNFDEVTEKETKEFQASKNLQADGIVGSQTMTEAYKLDYPEAFGDLGQDWPKNPGIKNLSFIDRQKLFGQFSYISSPTSNNPEAIKITDGWADNNIKTIVVPQLADVKGAPKNCAIQVHSKIADQTLSLFEAWEQKGLKEKILTWGGSWVPRFIRGSRTSLSNHAWGTAFDINVQWNSLGVVPARLSQKGCVRELVGVAAEHGFYWGGWFPSRPDGMHFEAYKII